MTYVKERLEIRQGPSGAEPQASEPVEPRCSSVPQLPTLSKWLKVERDRRTCGFIMNNGRGQLRMCVTLTVCTAHAPNVLIWHCVLYGACFKVSVARMTCPTNGYIWAILSIVYKCTPRKIFGIHLIHTSGGMEKVLYCIARIVVHDIFPVCTVYRKQIQKRSQRLQLKTS